MLVVERERDAVDAGSGIGLDVADAELDRIRDRAERVLDPRVGGHGDAAAMREVQRWGLEVVGHRLSVLR